MFQRIKSVIERIYEPPAITKIMQDQLYEAKRQELDHIANAEHHEALAMMYRSRAERLREAIALNKTAKRLEQ